MAGTQVLTPVPMVADGPGLNITTLLATPTGTTLQFTNTGREILIVSALTSFSGNLQVDVGTTVLGQAITNFTSVTLTATDIYAFGPFHSIDDQTGALAGSVQCVLSAIVNVTVGLLQTVGVY